MAGSVTVTMTPYPDAQFVKYALTWDTLGTEGVSGHTADLSVIQSGFVRQIQFHPKPFTQPLFYTAVLLDGDGVDLFTPPGGFQPQENLITLRPAFFYDASSPLDLIITDAVSQSAGVIELWFSQMAGDEEEL